MEKYSFIILQNLTAIDLVKGAETGEHFWLWPRLIPTAMFPCCASYIWIFTTWPDLILFSLSGINEFIGLSAEEGVTEVTVSDQTGPVLMNTQLVMNEA